MKREKDTMDQLFAIVLVLIVVLPFGGCDVLDPSEPGLLVPKTVEHDLTLLSLEINDTKLHVETFGTATDPIIVMLHGGPGADYRAMLKAQQFSEHGFFVVFYDQRGSGLSKREDKSQYLDNGPQLMIDDLDAIIRHFRISDTQKVILIGHSWGAMLATGYIDQNPHTIDGAILAEPGGLVWGDVEDYVERVVKIDFF